MSKRMMMLLILFLTVSCRHMKNFALYRPNWTFQTCKATCFNPRTGYSIHLKYCFSNDTIDRYRDGNRERLTLPFERCSKIAGPTLNEWATNILPVLRNKR